MSIDVYSMSKEQLIEFIKRDKEIRRRKKLNPVSFFQPQVSAPGLKDYQHAFWTSRKRERWVFGGNRSGKTMNGAAYVIEFCLQNPGARVWCVTWADLSREVQQKKIWSLLPKTYQNRKNPQGLIRYAKFTDQRGFANKSIVFANKSTIRFKTYDQGPDSFAGADLDLIWNDEEPTFDIYKEEKARLIDRNGYIINTMTPVNGITWVYDKIVENKKIHNFIDLYFWDSRLNKKINQLAFKNIIGQFDVKEAEVRTTGNFINLSSGRIYYAYDPGTHKRRLQVNPDYPMILSFDFNVNPMTTTMAQILPGRNANEQDRVLHIHRAINTPDSNTETQCTFIAKALQKWNGHVIIYGDASNPRRTEAANVNETNWYIIKKFFPKATYRVPDVNPNIKKRCQWVNSKFKNLDGKIGIYLDDRYTDAMDTDMKQVKWHKNQSKKDDTNPALNHNSDTLDYIVAQEFPLEEKAFATTDVDNNEDDYLNYGLGREVDKFDLTY